MRFPQKALSLFVGALAMVTAGTVSLSDAVAVSHTPFGRAMVSAARAARAVLKPLRRR